VGWTHASGCRHSLTENVCQQLTQIKCYPSSPGLGPAPYTLSGSARSVSRTCRLLPYRCPFDAALEKRFEPLRALRPKPLELAPPGGPQTQTPTRLRATLSLLSLSLAFCLSLRSLALCARSLSLSSLSLALCLSLRALSLRSLALSLSALVSCRLVGSEATAGCVASSDHTYVTCAMLRSAVSRDCALRSSAPRVDSSHASRRASGGCLWWAHASVPPRVRRVGKLVAVRTCAPQHATHNERGPARCTRSACRNGTNNSGIGALRYRV